MFKCEQMEIKDNKQEFLIMAGNKPYRIMHCSKRKAFAFAEKVSRKYENIHIHVLDNKSEEVFYVKHDNGNLLNANRIDIVSNKF